jgi:hypothetical protein
MKIVCRLTALLLSVTLIILSVRGFSFFVMAGGIPFALAFELVLLVLIISIFFCFFIVIPEVLD